MSKAFFRFREGRPAQPGDRASVLTTPAENRADVVAATGGVAVMRLYDPIDSWGGDWGVSAKEFAVALDALPADTNEIRLHINSPGGEVWEAVAILNNLRNHSARVVAIVDGLAASAASVIAAGADELIMGEDSEFMIHDAWAIAMGPASTMRDAADRLDGVSATIADVYRRKAEKNGSDKDAASWRELMLAESWLTADETVALGIADSVAGREAQPETDAAKAVVTNPAPRAEVTTDTPAPVAEGETDTPDGFDLEIARMRLSLRQRATGISAS